MFQIGRIDARAIVGTLVNDGVIRKMFPLVHEAVAKVLSPGSLRYIAFSHVEADECGALNDWLGAAP